VELVPYSPDDLWLTERIECDPVMMVHLGGPVPKEDIFGIHARRARLVIDGTWYFKVVTDTGEAAGTIGLWDEEFEGHPIYEMGWGILPEFQGQGLATDAGLMILNRARSDPQFTVVHAFPAVGNAPSNAICRKLGFEKLEEFDNAYRGRPLRCYNWRLSLRDADHPSIPQVQA